MMASTTVKVRIAGSDYAFPGYAAWIDERASVAHVGLPGLREATYVMAVRDIEVLAMDGRVLIENGIPA